MAQMSYTNRLFEDAHFVDEDYHGVDFSGSVFRCCSFKNVRFSNAKFHGCVFENCTDCTDVLFVHAQFIGCTLDICTFRGLKFNGADFTRAILKNVDMTGSNLSSVKFNKARLEGVTISKCCLCLASFVEADMVAITYLPTRNIPYMRGLHLFKKTMIAENTIFITGNSHLDFTDYCVYERRKDKFFANVNRTHPVLRPFAVIFLFLFGLLTDFGQSFTRWSVCTLGIVLAYAVIPVIRQVESLYDSLLASLLAFFGFGEIVGGYNYFYVSESILGYFMLGALISLLTSKLSLN